ncbi:ADP-ribosylglycohydrolase family protein [Methanoplanus sp. FWC-SCC4]|uniref:ADP-ribosylglycohydrolase family protein n=1 Tax=Methanochimaera problematica TaxID=2609417 RepID=A0AA97I1K2_9EURY|nr:ADP-ribosylglycohydrolase family protein [Methanoplanus sp. FWC-SCC4]WOF15240.1 ADP-ribosylglycohydrolase family protein [Methanoplanus sp. FWC-SCC4]
MQNEYRGAMLGGAVGDALGMPFETTPPSLRQLKDGYTRPPKWHPNSGLPAGGYTDDTQIVMLASELFASGNFSPATYAESLKQLHIRNGFRFADGTILTACRHLLKDRKENSGCNSTTAGCIPLGLPFALVYKDPVLMREELVKATAVTHTHPGAHAAVVSFASLIFSTINSDFDPLSNAQKNAFLEDETLGIKTGEAIRLAKDNISLDSALAVIGNDVSIYQTLPMAYYLIQKYGDYPDLLYIASQLGGNTDTIAFICGAWLGAEYGQTGIPDDLILGIENREKIESLANRLYYRFGAKN